MKIVKTYGVCRREGGSLYGGADVSIASFSFSTSSSRRACRPVRKNTLAHITAGGWELVFLEPRANILAVRTNEYGAKYEGSSHVVGRVIGFWGAKCILN